MKSFVYQQFLLLIVLLPLTYCLDAKNGEEEILRNLPCVTRLNQLFCTSTGSSYPVNSIDKFIVDNKALLRRMYGVLQEPRIPTRTLEESTRHLFRRDILEGTIEEMMFKEDRLVTAGGNGTASARARRQADFPDIPKESSRKKDVCHSTVEIVTPYWASNSNGKVRAILNNKEFEQAIHQEICSQSSTPRCSRDCRCEQKHKWHRLLAYDPNNDCEGIFMDWFLFPACCVCRCSSNPFI